MERGVIGAGLTPRVHKAKTKSPGEELAPLAERPGGPGAQGDGRSHPSSVGLCRDPCLLSHGCLLSLGGRPTLVALVVSAAAPQELGVVVGWPLSKAT